MRRRVLGLAGALALVFQVAVPLAAQTPAGKAAAPAKASSLRTVDGQPDLQGVWDFRTVTPMERPSQFANKEVLTDSEAAEFERERVEASNVDKNRDTKLTRGTVNGIVANTDVSLAYNDFWYDRGTKVVGTKRTSLVVDPSDGKIPALTPEAQKRFEARRLAGERPAAGPEDRGIGERCIMGFNAGPPVVPGGYNQNLQIFQTPGYVVILNEMVHSARVVPLDDRSFPNLRQWSGVSRGRWEGKTLVVETKNFNDVTSFRGSSPKLHLVERFTRADPETLIYEFTVNDPTTWAKAWTAQIPMRKSDQHMYEYACHEGNYGMFGILGAARAVDQEAASRGSK